MKKRRTVAAAFASAVRDLQASGVTARRAIADALNRRGVPTERNGRWHYTTVVRMLVRLGMIDHAARQPGAGAASRRASLVRARALAPLIRQLQAAGIGTPKAIARELNARGVGAPRGGKWHPTTVSRLLGRLRRAGATPSDGPTSQRARRGRRTRRRGARPLDRATH